MATFGLQARALFALAFSLMAFSVVAAAAELPAPPAGLAAPVKPVRMPAFNLPLAAGGNARAEDFRDTVVVMCFWASW